MCACERSGKCPSDFGQWSLRLAALAAVAALAHLHKRGWLRLLDNLRQCCSASCRGTISKQHHKLLCMDSQWLACRLLARSKGGSGTYFVIQKLVYPSAHLGRIGPNELLRYDKKNTCVQFLCALFVRPSTHQGRTGPDTGVEVCLSVCHVRPSVSLIRV